MLVEEIDALMEQEYVSHHHVLPMMLWKGVNNNTNKLCLVKLFCSAQHEPVVLHLQVLILFWKEVKVVVKVFQLRDQIPQLQVVGILDFMLEILTMVLA